MGRVRRRRRTGFEWPNKNNLCSVRIEIERRFQFRNRKNTIGMGNNSSKFRRLMFMNFGQEKKTTCCDENTKTTVSIPPAVVFVSNSSFSVVALHGFPSQFSFIYMVNLW